MRVRVLLFGLLKDIYHRSAEDLDLPAGATVQSVLDHYAQLAPEQRTLWPTLAVSVNQEYAQRSHALNDGDEIALLPPVSGGAPEAKPEPLVKIVHERIVPHDIVPPTERPEDGAIVIFDGIVRNHSRGRRTLYLDYESYEPMALAEMQKLARETQQRFAIRQVALVHRLGRLNVGESSVLIAVFSAHRAAAFDACRYLIDTLKKTVPIWKKEYFKDGAVWADGEPFPPEIAGDARRDSASK